MSLFYWFGVTLFWCILTALTHWYCFRRMMKAKKNTGKSYLVVPLSCVGFMFLIRYMESVSGSGPSFPLSSMLLYIGLVAFYFIYLQGALLGEESPSGKVIEYLKTHPGATYADIEAQIDESHMVHLRLEQLITGGYVRQSRNGYTITDKGSVVAKAFNLFRGVMGLRSGG